MTKRGIPKSERDQESEQIGLETASVEQTQPEYKKLVGKLFAENPAILKEAQVLLSKFFKNKDAGKTGWGFDPDNFRRKFASLIPETIRKSYRKEVSGKDAVYYANFVRELVKETQVNNIRTENHQHENAPVGVSPKSYSQQEHQILAQNKAAAELEKKPQVLNVVLPEFQKDPVGFSYSDKIFKIAKDNGIVASQIVRFLYEYFGQSDKFNELRKVIKPKANFSKEQVLLRELVNLLEPQRGEREKKAGSNFFISKPDKTARGHRFLFFDADVPTQTGGQFKTVRFKVQLPYGADIGKGQELYNIALDIAKQRDPISLTSSEIIKPQEFLQAWRESQSPAEAFRIEQRGDFIKNAKKLFDYNPEEFILNDKLAEFAAGIPNEEAIRYLADEEFIGEFRQEYHKKFEELKSKPDTELAKFVGLNKDEAENLTREQLLLRIVAELLKHAKIESARAGKKGVEMELAAKKMIETEEEAAEDLEGHPAVIAAKGAMFADFKEQMKGMDFTEEELSADFEKYWEKGLFRQLVEELKNEKII